MHNRPSFDPRFAHGQQAGGTVEQRQSAAGVPAMFLPNYSGDGRGVSKAASLEAELPQWSGDGRHSVANPLMPVFQADGYGHRATRQAAVAKNDDGSVQPPQALPTSGDGRGSLELSDEISMTVRHTSAQSKTRIAPSSIVHLNCDHAAIAAPSRGKTRLGLRCNLRRVDRESGVKNARRAG